jgi:hypothetical protein
MPLSKQCFVDIRKKVVDEGGLKAVVKAMEENEENSEVQRWGCFALLHLLSEESSPWAKMAVDAGGIGLAIAAMNNRPDAATLQRYGCKFLCRLSKANKQNYRVAILDAKGLIPVGEALRIHQNNKHVKQTAQDALAAISK